MKKIGVLALQGAFREHISMLDRLGADAKEIRRRSDFTSDLDGLILPGGESTVIAKLLGDLNLSGPVKEAARGGMAVFGTCAGMILLAKKVEQDDLPCLGLMDITVRRNAFGRQLGSFCAAKQFAGVGQVPMVFIRAPYIVSAGNNVEVLSVADGKIVAARQENLLAAAFHPELTEDTRIHEYFLSMIS